MGAVERIWHMDIQWQSTAKLDSKSYQCGHCEHRVGSDKGYFAGNPLDAQRVLIYICPYCARATFFHGDEQIPDVRPGNEVDDVPDDVDDLYNEARSRVAASAYTASVLCCRKLLMNIGVSRGAKAGLSFVEYVDYLSNQGYVPPNGRSWVDHIRNKGNEATHEIALMTREDANELISFAEMLLKFIYEFPAKVPVPKLPSP